MSRARYRRREGFGRHSMTAAAMAGGIGRFGSSIMKISRKTTAVILLAALLSTALYACSAPSATGGISSLPDSVLSGSGTEESSASSGSISTEDLSGISSEPGSLPASQAASSSAVSKDAEAKTWYTQKTLSGVWKTTTQILFSGGQTADREAVIYLGSSSKSPVIRIRILRKKSGEILASAAGASDSAVLVPETSLGKTKDTAITVALVNSGESRTIVLRMTGDKTFSGFLETAKLDAAVLGSLKYIGWPSASAGVQYKNTAVEKDIADSDAYRRIASSALDDLYDNFWQGDSETGHIVKEDHGFPTTGRQVMIWAHAMMLFGMETMYEATGDEDIKKKIQAHWAFTKDIFNEEEMITPGRAPNIACDDAGWDAMAYLTFYRFTGDPYALNVTKKLLYQSYDYWKDGSVENGLWYKRSTDPAEDAKWKSLYSTGLMMAALEYYEITGDETILNDTLAIYRWIETYLLRNGRKEYGSLIIDVSDNLYWADFNVNRAGRTEVTGPDGGVRPFDIHEAGSVSFLGGNMAMAVIHAKLYKITGDEKYLARALETVRAIDDSRYNCLGVYLDDRDAWTTATFTRWWVKDVLTLPGIKPEDYKLLKDTAQSIFTRARTADGYYGGSWSGPADGDGSKWYRIGSVPKQIMTSSNSCNMIFAAALLEKLGY